MNSTDNANPIAFIKCGQQKSSHIIGVMAWGWARGNVYLHWFIRFEWAKAQRLSWQSSVRRLNRCLYFSLL
jgi:hypothetical protein